MTHMKSIRFHPEVSGDTSVREPTKPLPEFVDEAEERAFWESPKNDSSEYVDWSKATPVSFPELRPSTNTISLRKTR
jgi:hypothetical protein